MSDIGSYDLVIYDENCEAIAQEFKNRSNRFEEIITQYTEIVQRIIDSGVKEGKVHDNLVTFLEAVAELKDQSSDLADEAATCMTDFLSDIDTADSYLY